MKQNYWEAKDTAYGKWDESEMRQWLVSEGVMYVLLCMAEKFNKRYCSTNDAADLKKEKYQKLMDEHYTNAKSTVFGSWYDSEMRAWLVDHGFLKSDAQAQRDDVSLTIFLGRKD